MEVGGKSCGAKNVLILIACFAIYLCYFLLNSDVGNCVTFTPPKVTWSDLSTLSEGDTETEFTKQWVRMLQARLDWKGILAPCLGNTDLNKMKPGWEDVYATVGDKSFVKSMDIRPAGQFTRLYIQTRDKYGRDKTIGGDFWIVVLTGPANVSATIFDYGNGTYEALVLLLEPGIYSIHAFIERTLCEGFKEPPKGFFKYLMDIKIDNLLNKTRASELGILRDNLVMKKIQGYETLKVQVPSTTDNVDKRLKAVSEIPCKRRCRVIWNGYGRWINEKWVPLLSSDDHDLKTLLRNRKIKTEETFATIGDSVTSQFAIEYFKYANVCSILFQSCNWDTTHLYPVDPKHHPKSNLFTKDYGDIKTQFRMEIVLDAIKDIFRLPGMSKSSSVLLLSFNIHYARQVTFSTYQNAIQNIILLLKNRKKLLGSDARVVWRTTTAARYGTASAGYNGRFLTNNRLRLFDAYSMSEMCKAGFEIFDWYPTGASSLTAWRDHFHFRPEVYHKAIDTFTWYVVTAPEKRSRDMCFG